MRLTLLVFALFFLTDQASFGQQFNTVELPERSIESPQHIFQLHKPSVTKEIDQHDLIRPLLHTSGETFETYNFRSPLQRTFTEKPGLALLSSAILPGSGRAVNGNWVMAGVYFAVEASAIYLTIDSRNSARSLERSYQQFANENWSVVEYAQWIVEYYDFHGLTADGIDDLRSMVDGKSATFNNDIDWDVIDIQTLRAIERNTPYFSTDHQRASNFSHVLPDYGTQQYYELISKYYQFQGGWRDYRSSTDTPFYIGLQGENASPFFIQGAVMSRQFNGDYRTSRNLMSLLIANHVIAAFDSFFTFSVKQNRLQTIPSAIPGEQLRVRYSF
ncbi:MAG: hypothetical protein ACNA78_03570 [Balneolaceae bacterium]